MKGRGEGSVRQDSVERYAIASSRERWLDFLALEHSTLPLPRDFSGSGEDLIVVRPPRAGRPVSQGRIPARLAPAIFLQAAAAACFFQASGSWLDEDDLRGASWDIDAETPRLWLPWTPAAVRRADPRPSSSAVLSAFLRLLFPRGRAVAHPAARELLERLESNDAAERRPDFWVAAAFRVFPELAAPAASGVRARMLGSAGMYSKPAARRGLLEKARALLDDRVPRVFAAGISAVVPAGALGLEDAGGRAVSLAAAVRALRDRHARESGGRRARWIAVDPDRWDALSRRAFEAAARALGDAVEVVIVPASTAPPLLADEWRREIFVPCGTLTASLRFYERFAALAREEPSGAWRLAELSVGAPEWAAFVRDPTGEAPFPEPRLERGTGFAAGESGLESEIRGVIEIAARPVRAREIARLLRGRPVVSCLRRLENAGRVERDRAGRWRPGPRVEATPLSPSKREEICRRWAELEPEPGRRVELLLAGGERDSALAEAQGFIEDPSGSPERWFGMSALLSASIAPPLPPWLEALEAEREAAGGRLEEAESRLARLDASAGLEETRRRAIRLRLAEIVGERGRPEDAAQKAAAWRREFSGAPARETVRALVLEARGRGRRGEHEAALALLDEAERAGAALPIAERLEIALARAGVLSLAGRFREEEEIYDRWRPAVRETGDEPLSARLLSRQALGLADRREFPAAVARLEEAIAASRDDPVESARLSLNLASTLYHAGRPARCRELLDQAVELASSAGREDIARTARSNRLQLSIDAGQWQIASEETEDLVRRAAAEGDETRLVVALHHRSRLALRRGRLVEAAADNARARELAEKLRDRLETGELWLEEGDRLLYEGEAAAARAAWEAAAADPPDRCDSAERARQRLSEISWAAGSAPPESASRELAALFESDELAAAEQAARWHRILEGGLRGRLRERAEGVLRARGAVALADRVFGPGAPAGSAGAAPALAHLRALRDAAAVALGGELREAPLPAFGLCGLVLSDSDAREILRFGQLAGDSSRRRLDAGASTYELALSPPLTEAATDAVALVLETLLFRPALAEPPSDFAEGWRRLGVIAGDSSMEEPYRRLVRLAPAPVTVLVRGESGSGKEAVARAVHALSPRSPSGFVAVNVPAVPAALLESELFGHARGAFTGADRDRKGLLEEAEGGTIFFDEIGDLSPPLQAKLLRALQEREIRRVGENRARRLDVRVVSATSRDLEREVEAGRFREDLYYRLHVAVIMLPPLRERGRDVVLLARHFLERCSREFSRGRLAFAPETLALLCAHSWPGNVRELQNAVSQAAALAEPGSVIGPDLLPEPLRRRKPAPSGPESYRARVNQHRRDLVVDALERARGNRSRAARDLGLTRQALAYLIREFNVTLRPRSSHREVER